MIDAVLSLNYRIVAPDEIILRDYVANIEKLTRLQSAHAREMQDDEHREWIDSDDANNFAVFLGVSFSIMEDDDRCVG